MKLRHSPEFVLGSVRRIASNNDMKNEVLQINLFEKDKGIASGQFAAFYQENICLGAGVIMDIPFDLPNL